MHRNLKNLIALTAALLLCFSGAWVGRVVTHHHLAGWYAEIKKPAWTPPGATIGIVWTILYTMMAVSLWLIWKKKTQSSKSRAYLFFGIQLFLNFIWSLLFFGLESPALALVNIALLLISIGLTIKTFYRIDRFAAYLLIPYLIWVAYASSLNAAIWLLN